MKESLLDFENEKREKGYKPFQLTPESIAANIGKTICYVDYVEPHRGTYFVRYGVIHGSKRKMLIIDNGNKEIEISKIKECGIKI